MICRPGTHHAAFRCLLSRANPTTPHNFAKMLPISRNFLSLPSYVPIGEVITRVNGRRGLYMHKLIEAAGRRSAGVAAGVILTGGLVGGVLLAPAAYAATGATISITSATPGFGGVTVSVSVTNGTDPLGTFSVSGAGGSCTGDLSGGLFGMSSNGNGTGSCTIRDVAPGTYALTASYDGATGAGSVTVPTQGPTPGPTQNGNAPVWSSDSP